MLDNFDTIHWYGEVTLLDGDVEVWGLYRDSHVVLTVEENSNIKYARASDRFVAEELTEEYGIPFDSPKWSK